jgi:3-hydroxyisobutyrate dehydrogenase
MVKKDTKIGWIGTGVMGLSMCGHILHAGYPVSVYSRTKSKADPLIKNGARWKENPKEVAENADIVFSIVSYPTDVEEVILSESGVLEGLRRGGTIVDMTTSSPRLAEEIYERAKAKGVRALDAPVSGGDVGAKNAVLSIMVGGEKDVFSELLPLFQLMGKSITHTGKAGNGQHMKMANQIHVATTMIGVVECLLYAYKAGLDLDATVKAVGSGAASTWSLNNYGPKIIKRNFDPGFFIEHFVKDMGIALDEAKRMNLALPGLSLVHQFYLVARAQGLEKLGIHALYMVMEKMNAIEAG